jgi:hypothetical protein
MERSCGAGPSVTRQTILGIADVAGCCAGASGCLSHLENISAKPNPTRVSTKGRSYHDFHNAYAVFFI